MIITAICEGLIYLNVTGASLGLLGLFVMEVTQ